MGSVYRCQTLLGTKYTCPFVCSSFDRYAVSVHFFKIIFCPTSSLILKQLDNSPSLSMSDSQLVCALLTVCCIDNSGSLSNCTTIPNLVDND